MASKPIFLVCFLAAAIGLESAYATGWKLALGPLATAWAAQV